MFTLHLPQNSMGAGPPSTLSVSLFGSGGSTFRRRVLHSFLRLRLLRIERSELAARPARAALGMNEVFAREPEPVAHVAVEGMNGHQVNHGA